MKTKETTIYVTGTIFLLLITIGLSAQSVITIGKMKIWKLQDAQITLKTTLLKDIDQAEAKKLNGGSENQTTPVNAFVVKMPGHVVLVDAGIGKGSGEDSGKMPEQLKAIGIEPASIDLILLTHLHFDHIGGLTTPEGTRQFPNATIRLSKAESDFWLGDITSIPASQQERAKQI